MLLLGPVFSIPYDRLPGFRAFCEALSVIKFDIDFLHIGCISFSYSFHTKLYSISVVALVLQAGVVGLMLLFWFMPTCTPSAKAVITKLAGWMLVGTYFLYPSVCATIFSSFNCDTIDSVAYLIADYSIDCNSKEHVAAEGFAGFMIAAFAVGLPALYMCLLVAARRSSTDEDSEMLDFFHADYKDEYFYWSVCPLCAVGDSHVSRFVCSGKSSSAAASCSSQGSPSSSASAPSCRQCSASWSRSFTSLQLRGFIPTTAATA